MRKKKTSPEGPAKAPEEAKKKSFPIVGIGASAGGLEALETFFDNMPPDSGMAFVIIQHLSPQHKSIMGQLLMRRTQMQVLEIKDRLTLEPNCVYFNPPSKEVGTFHGDFHLVEPVATSAGVRLPIDYFFRSLAEDRGEKAICIILSGTGSDGTLGLEAVKGAGGMTMAQAEEQAKYPGMPKSAIDTGLVDAVLPVEKMPEELLRYGKHPYLEAPTRTVVDEKKFENFAQKILMLVRAATGHDFAHYKQNTIRRRMERRMALHKLTQISDYHRFLQEHPPEVKALFKDMLITVSSFFRDAEAFEILGTQVLPNILQEKATGEGVRIWAPGCAAGEETLSIAILVAETMEKMGKHLDVQIFGTDIDADAIERARAAEYPDSIAADVSPERLRRFFIKKDGVYKIKQEIREMVVYAVQNLISDPPFSKLDLVSCRNLLIYLDVELQKKILPLFHFTLTPSGYLFLGSSESIGAFADLFKPLDVKWKIFQRKSLVLDKRLAYPPPALADTAPLSIRPLKKAAPEVNLRELMGKIILDTYAPPAVLINENFDILYFQGHTDRYLSTPVGEPSYNILKLARSGLVHKLSTILRQAVREKRLVTFRSAKVRQEDRHAVVDLTVQPLLPATATANLFLVVFDDKTPAKAAPKKRGKEDIPEPETDARVINLEQDLQATKESLQTTIEELEASNEELKSTNEELQSTNEELQSTNEELETAKEELQSTNEELMTVNAELQTKVDELMLVNDDINNLLASTEIGTIFLDGKLRIKRFTANMTRLFNLIHSDLNRSIRDITSKIPAYDLVADAESVLKTLQSQEKDIKTEDGKWFSKRIMPYRTRENVIDGVVITFVDITDRRQAAQELEAARVMCEGMANFLGDPLLILGDGLRVLSANQAFYRFFKASEPETLGKSLYALGNGGWDAPELRELLEELIPDGAMESRELTLEFPQVGVKTLRVRARALVSPTGRPPMTLLALEEV